MSEPTLSESPALPLLFAQLQTRYPTSGLLTELIQMEVDRCVVRALVQLGSLTLATSMATAATVEQAEDLARLRVLALLGIHSTPFSVPPVSSSYSPSTPSLTSQDTTQFVSAMDGVALQETLPTATLPNVEPIAPPFPFPTLAFEPSAPIAMTSLSTVEPATASTVIDGERAFEAPPDRDDAPYNEASYDEVPYDDAPYDEAPYEAEPFETGSMAEEGSSSAPVSLPAIEEPAAKSKPRKTSADKRLVSETNTSDDASSDRASRDLSSLISEIGVEIDRIGWSKRQGSIYLQKTYGKKTRSELTDDELEDFLTYLNTQPSVTAAL